MFPFAFNIGDSERWTRGMSAYAEEMSQFVQSRWQNDMDNWAKLTTCRTPIEVLECQQRYVEKTVADYFDEVGKLSRLALTTATRAFSSAMASSAKTAETA